MEREWNGRRGEWDGRIWRSLEREWDGGSGVLGPIEHADPKLLYYWKCDNCQYTFVN
jgi:hypothetical protein